MSQDNLFYQSKDSRLNKTIFSKSATSFNGVK